MQNKLKPINKNSQEWNQIEFMMQLQLGSTAAVIRNLDKIDNPSTFSNFKHVADNLTVSCFVEASSLQVKNNIQNVIAQGFSISKEGRLFRTGQLDLKQKKDFNILLLCRLSVGKSKFLHRNNTLDRSFVLQPPQGFDSFYLYDDQPSRKLVHDYIFFDSHRVLPQYRIQFFYDSKRQKSMMAPMCICGKYQAKRYCINQDTHYCLSCDKEQHTKGVSQKHKRVQIKEKPKNYGQCQIHSDSKNEMYCNNCVQPLCVQCKIGHSSHLQTYHNQGDKAHHKLMRIKQAYQQAINKAKVVDVDLDNRKSKLMSMLTNMQGKINDINRNATLVEQELKQRFEHCLRELKLITKKKLAFLVADQLQIRRQYDQIDWCQNFLKYFTDVLQPVDFLAQWNRYLVYKKDLLKNVNIPISSQFRCDIKCVGNLRVVEQLQKKSVQEIIEEDSYNNRLFKKYNFNKEEMTEQTGLFTNVKSIKPDLQLESGIRVLEKEDPAFVRTTQERRKYL